jgi:CNT family concentrative nucleoside transporter
LFGTSLESILGWLFAPIAFLMGIPWKEAVQVGSLLGQKTVLNEFVAYLNLARGLASGQISLSERSLTIATYALCGFANFGSLGIMIAGIGGMAPSKRHDLARLGILSIISGSLAAFLTAAIAGVLV